MRTFKILSCLLALVTLGCRTDPNTMLLERDLRLQEDKIFHLQGMLEDCCAAREAAARENEELKRQLGRDGGSSNKDPRGSSDRVDNPSRSRPRDESPSLQAPQVEIPGTDTPAVEMSPGVEVNPNDSNSAVLEGKPARLVINKQLTGGLDSDGQDGDEGILVVVEPRDAGGQLVKSAGTISVALMDYSLKGEAARVARWDFAADELASHFRNTSLMRGLQFELPWPGQPPKHRDLQLYVRFTSSRGEKLTAETKIQVRTPGDPPRVDRETRNSTPTQSAARPAVKGPPGSRLKATRNKSASLDDAEEEEPSEDSPVEPRRSRSDVEHQASRPDAPVWKPYR